MKFYLIVFLLFFVSACGGPTYRTRVIDSPRTGALKPWEKPYEVNGQRYQPLRGDNHVGYVEEGIASWYGRDFHGKKTSNGETYDMHGRTAAHKTLPLGIYVKVRNLANGKEAVARVNDRGPFVRGRIIDLSYTLAKDLGVVDAGTAPVRIEALGFREGDAGNFQSRQPRSDAPDSFAVQIGSFSVRENADRLAAQMRSRHGAAGVKEERVGGKLFYRVRVGSYRSQDAAEKAREDLARGGYGNSFVVAME
ncbi:MAG: septal ring lytic transglycosylase RlpA family protein [Desulfuromonadales bacterium]